MNERLQQLASKARIKDHWSIDEGRYLTNYLDEQKFAELIVRECADIAYKTSWDDLVHGYGQAVIPLHLHNTIKQHFGVKE
jgi:hypothetical protein